MTRDILTVAKGRHTTKAFDATRRISPEVEAQLKDLLRFSPSSTNAQPWHFIMASTPDGKRRIANSTSEKYPFNEQSLLDASHVVAFASHLDMTDHHLNAILNQEEADGRFDGDLENHRSGMDGARRMFIDLHRYHYKDLQHWMEKQVYLNIGQFMLGAAALGVDTTPMEGIDLDVLDEEFDLRSRGYSSIAVVALGYHHTDDDYNARLPKSRLPLSYTMTTV